MFEKGAETNLLIAFNHITDIKERLEQLDRAIRSLENNDIERGLAYDLLKMKRKEIDEERSKLLNRRIQFLS